MVSRTNWLLLINAALGSFLAGTASRIFAVSLPTVTRSLDTTIVGISWAVISFQISTISLSLVFGRIGSGTGPMSCGFRKWIPIPPVGYLTHPTVEK